MIRNQEIVMESEEMMSDEEDREARMYAMLHFVDSETAENSATTTNNSQLKNNENEIDKTPIILSNDNNPSVIKEQTATTLNEGDSFSNTSNEIYKNRPTNSRRYWTTNEPGANTPREINTPFVKINNNKNNSKDAVTSAEHGKKSDIITVSNTRKRRSSEFNSERQTASDNSEQPKLKGITSKEKSTSGILNTDKSSEISLPSKQSVQTPQSVKSKSNHPFIVEHIESDPSPATNKKTRATKSNKADKSESEKKKRTKKSPKQNDTASGKIVTPVKKVRIHKPRTPLAQIFKAGQELSRAFQVLKSSFSKPSNVIPITIDSSDDDVVEVELPPNISTTIDLDSSDESTIEISKKVNKVQGQAACNEQTDATKDSNRKRSVSPVPSIISTMSDDFIQGDLSTLNITGGSPDITFNFELHGLDLCEGPIESIKNCSKKKSQQDTESNQIDKVSSTSAIPSNIENSNDDNQEGDIHEDECFAMPKSKMNKRRNSKSKSYSVTDQLYVTPSVDIYESESSDIPESIVDVPITPKTRKRRVYSSEFFSKQDTIDSTIKSIDIESSDDTLVMANVVGIQKPQEFEGDDEKSEKSATDNLQKSSAASKIKKKQKNKLKPNWTDDKDLYYNTMYGADFDHLKLKNKMPKEREFWELNPADKGRPKKAFPTCGHCNKTGHRSEMCFKKPKICYMCGASGHVTTRCPNKICLNCGSPSSSFSSDCSNCRSWKNTLCQTCRQYGHPYSKCPDIWRRYHLTVKNEIPLVEDRKTKPNAQLYCSGCARRGHLIHKCDRFIKFSDFKPLSPYIFHYTPVYKPDGVRNPENIVPLISDSDASKTNMRNTPRSPVKKKNNSSNHNMNSKQTKKYPNLKSLLQEPSANPKPLLQLAISKPLPQSSDISKQSPQSSVTLKPSLQPLVILKPLLQPVSNTKPSPQVSVSFDNKRNTESPKMLKKVDIYGEKLNDKVIENNLKNQECLNTSDFKKKNVFDIQENAINKNEKCQIQEKNEKMQDENTNASKENLVENNVSSDAHLLLTKEHYERLGTLEGTEFLKQLAIKCDLEFKKNDKCTSLTITGNSDSHFKFQSEIQEWMKVKEHVPTNFLPRNHIPKKRQAAIKKLLDSLRLLHNDLGNPLEIYEVLKATEKELVKCELKNKIGNHYIKSTKSLGKFCRLLNMTLIGQAGLCGGTEICQKLNEKILYLKSQKFSDMDLQIRDEMGEYFETIFSSSPRSDYPELIKEYSESFRPINTAVRKSDKNKTVRKMKIFSSTMNFKDPQLRQGLLKKLKHVQTQFNVATRRKQVDPDIRDITEELFNWEFRLSNGKSFYRESDVYSSMKRAQRYMRFNNKNMI